MNTARHLPKSLFFRLILFLLSAFFVLHTLAILTLADFFERHLVQNMLANHSATIALCVRMLEAEPAPGRPALVASLAKISEVTISVQDKKPDMPQGQDKLSRFFLDHIKEALDDMSVPGQEQRALQAQVQVIVLGKESGENPSFFDKFFSLWDVSGSFVAHLTIQLANGTWLNITYGGPGHRVHLEDMPYLVLALEFFIFAALLVLIVHRLVRPLRSLARAAESFGLNQDLPHTVPDEGPSEVRHAAQAFNAMQKRIRGIMEERERIFAALSHDLRTPLTRMRLRLESAPGGEFRQKMLEDVHSLHAIVEMGTAMTQCEKHAEPPTRTDMQAFLEAIVEDRREMGQNVTMLGANLKLSALIFPVALRRCLDNLLDNALRYGQEAVLAAAVLRGPGDRLTLRVDIDDKGPGMDPALLEKVFEPFFRVEGSRNRHTGGHGLGLSIARSMAGMHKATLNLSNLPQGGLRARLELPLIEGRPA
ncbi:MAG: ATP-binding protein [Desulfovibrio sp.]|nr:ATP-binding protein [Desulfovibrio sp.]